MEYRNGLARWDGAVLCHAGTWVGRAGQRKFLPGARNGGPARMGNPAGEVESACGGRVGGGVRGMLAGQRPAITLGPGGALIFLQHPECIKGLFTSSSA